MGYRADHAECCFLTFRVLIIIRTIVRICKNGGYSDKVELMNCRILLKLDFCRLLANVVKNRLEAISGKRYSSYTSQISREIFVGKDTNFLVNIFPWIYLPKFQIRFCETHEWKYNMRNKIRNIILQQIPCDFRFDTKQSAFAIKKKHIRFFQKVHNEVNATWAQPDFTSHIEIDAMKIRL